MLQVSSQEILGRSYFHENMSFAFVKLQFDNGARFLDLICKQCILIRWANRIGIPTHDQYWSFDL